MIESPLIADYTALQYTCTVSLRLGRVKLVLEPRVGYQACSRPAHQSDPTEVNGADVVGLQLQVASGGNVTGQFHEQGDVKINWPELDAVLLMVPESEEEGRASE